MLTYKMRTLSFTR